MKKRIRITAAFAAIVLLFTCMFSVSAGALSFECDVEQFSDSMLMVNLDTGMEVFVKDADTKRYPAALTKIMTYIVAAEHFDDLNTQIPIKQSCIDAVLNGGMSCSGVDWYVGESMTVESLLYAMMLPAGHDAAMVLADYVGEGKLQTFVDLMNSKAVELGCENTHFTNPFGVHDDNHYTTARDLYKITKYAIDLATLFHRFYDGCSVKNAETPELRDARLLLCSAVRQTIRNVLTILNIEQPEKM